MAVSEIHGLQIHLLQESWDFFNIVFFTAESCTIFRFNSIVALFEEMLQTTVTNKTEYSW
jgi:hypothetical protein